jgi:hypothetical protein
MQDHADEQQQLPFIQHEGHMFARSTFLVQLLSIPLPLICTGQGDYENGTKDVGNSHDLISTILGRILVVHENSTQEILKILQGQVLEGCHTEHLLSFLRSVAAAPHENIQQGYEALCTYTRAVIEKLVELDISSSAQSLDIRFVKDIGTISKAVHGSLVGNALEHARAMAVLYEMDDMNELEKDATSVDYQNIVAANLGMIARVAVNEGGNQAILEV